MLARDGVRASAYHLVERARLTACVKGKAGIATREGSRVPPRGRRLLLCRRIIVRTLSGILRAKEFLLQKISSQISSP